MSDGTMEAPTRWGARERGPTASSAPSATASAPARFRAVRRVTGAAESNGYVLLALASRRDEPGTRHKRHDPRGCRHPGQPGQDEGPFGPFVLCFFRKVRTGPGP